MPADANLSIMLDEIIVPEHRKRSINKESIGRLASSIDEVGLRHPITVKRERGGNRYVLIAGLHRLEAVRKLGREHIQASIVSMTNDEAEMWEIAENLHRAELTKLERSEHIERWRALKAKVGEIPPPGGQQPRAAGVRETAEELGVDKKDVQDARKVASLTDDAKDAARETGMDDNQSVLLAAAKEDADKQADAIREAAEKKKSGRSQKTDKERQVEAQFYALRKAWARAGREAREEFLAWIDKPVMDRSAA